MPKSVFTVDKANLVVRTERFFNATPERLFKAYTDPEQIPQWWGPAALTTVVDKMDLRVGGAWRFVQTETGPGGKEHAFSGVYKVIDEPHKIVDTFEYEPMPGHILEETITFELQPDGTTKLSAVAHYANLEDLEGMVNMGMESGAVESQDRLAKLVESS
jgi:uncharacterized protein YndB with AHSA1/START domain